MILVDTSVWIDHLRRPERELIRRLREGRVLMHTMIVGELACGNLNNRHERMRVWQTLPQVPVLSHPDVLTAMDARDWSGKDLGFVDVHLLASVPRREDTLLWGRDKRLVRFAGALNVAYVESNRE